MKNLLPIVPSYLLEFPLPILLRQGSSSENTSSEANLHILVANKDRASFCSEENPPAPLAQMQHNTEENSSTPNLNHTVCSNSPTSTTSSPATSGLVGDFKSLSSNISGALQSSNNSSNECLNITTGIRPPSVKNDTTSNDLTTKNETTNTSCTSNAVNPNKSFSILVS